MDQQKYNPEMMSEIAESSAKQYNDEDYILTPCRFAKSGWKYVKRNATQVHLNHPNKINTIGYCSGTQSSKGHGNSSLGRIEEESQLFLDENMSLNKSLIDTYKSPSKTVISNRKTSVDQYSTAKSVYQQEFENRAVHSKKINELTSKDIKGRERLKEYNQAPLPNLVQAKQAYMK